MNRPGLSTRGLVAGLALAATLPLSAQEPPANFSTGPDVGEKIPAFEAVDQNGDKLTFDDIKGPNGALVLFHRSADW